MSSYLIERKRMQTILTAFSDFIRQSPDFDFLHSEKFGLVYIVQAGDSFHEALQIKSPEDLLEILFLSVVDSVACVPGGRRHVDNSLTEAEEAESCRRLKAILESISDDCAYYFEQLDQFYRDKRWL